MAGFREKLQAELDARDFGARTLAKLLDPANVENKRRDVRRYLSGETTPRDETREQIEDVLGLDRGALSDDDEEDSLADSLLGIAASMAPGWEDSRRTWVEQQRERIFREAAEKAALA